MTCGSSDSGAVALEVALREVDRIGIVLMVRVTGKIFRNLGWPPPGEELLVDLERWHPMLARAEPAPEAEALVRV